MRKVKASCFCSTVISLSVCLVVSTSNFASAKAPVKNDFDDGIAAYKARDYKSAVQFFRKCIESGKGNSDTWLYLGHAYLSMQQTQSAMATYVTVTERYPNTAASQEAIRYLTRLDPSNAAKRIAASTQPKSDDSATFIDRINVHPPAPGHPPVCQATLDAVRAVLKGLPPQVYKYLSDGKATITIAPNIVDKWPGSGDGAKPTDESTTMGEEEARTYNHDIHIYERAKKRGVDLLLERRSATVIACAAYHEIGHAVDDIGHFFSEKPEFKSAFAADLNSISSEEKKAHRYFLDSGEAFAETFAALLGSPSTDSMVDEMKRTSEHVKRLFRL